MSFLPLGPSVSESLIIRILQEKLDQSSALRFRFVDHLNSFAEKVSSEVEFIRVTFPEFTDHTAQIHFPNLFKLADRLLGEELLGKLYLEELFLLAAALYAHDWGMAVSTRERDLILSGTRDLGTSPSFCLLLDEHQRFGRFLKDNGITAEPERTADVPDQLWREYVRQTHAERSAIRASSYFEAIDGGIAQAVAALCKGHWLDLETIDAELEFPAELNVLEARVNLRSLALFVRLIDLFDISEDRTPFALWRFVDPKDPRSVREWRKHRALRPVHTEKYLQGRCVVVDGTATEPELYADLLDLRDYCEQQLRQTCDLLARHRDARIVFDLAPIIHWNVKPLGFEPSEIRFEFDRKRMFEILGGEIYHGDPCVFLRELLQNAIDAIRTRRELQKRRPREGVVSGVIEFHVLHFDDGNCVVTCRDNGTGMDEYIIRRYLAVPGKSYYRSSDFSRLSLTQDPISRFGIGILSCFMVAERVEIVTRRDPNISAGATGLRLEVIAPERQWRVYREPADCPVGTAVTVCVQGDRLFADDGEKVSRLPVTEYIAAIAGFVEFPILVEELFAGDEMPRRRSVILHPDFDRDIALSEFGPEIEIHQLAKQFPFEKVVIAEDLDLAREHFTSVTLDIEKEALMEGCGGFIALFCPRNESYVACPVSDEDSEKKGLSLIDPDSGSEISGCIGIIRGARGYVESQSGKLTRSARIAPNWSVYVDGILLAGAKEPQRWDSDDALLPVPIVRLNYQRRGRESLAVSRLHMERDSCRWDELLWDGLKNCVASDKVLSLSEEDWVRGSISHYIRNCSYALTPQEYADEIIDAPRLACWINSDGTPEVAVLRLGDSEVSLIPTGFTYEAEWYISDALLNLQGKDSIDTLWRGPRSIVPNPGYSARAHNYILANKGYLGEVAAPKRLQFLAPPSPKWPPMPQEVWVGASSDERELAELIDIGRYRPMDLTWRERSSLVGSFDRLSCWNAFRSIPFSAPFEAALFCGSDYWNANHPTTTAIIRVVTCLERELDIAPASKSLGHLRVLYKKAIEPFLYSRNGDMKEIARAWHAFWTEFEATRLLPDLASPDLPQVHDAVPGTWLTKKGTFTLFDWGEASNVISFRRPFGELITDLCN